MESQRGAHYVEAVVAVRPRVVEQRTRRLLRQEPMKEEHDDGRSMREHRSAELEGREERRTALGKKRPHSIAVQNREEEHHRWRAAPPRAIEPEDTSHGHQEEEEEEEEPDRYQITIAILIAVITFMGALIAWQSAFASGRASEGDFGRLYPTLNAEQTQSLNKASVLRNYRAYTAYTRHNQEVTLLDETPPQAASASQENQEIVGEPNAVDMRAEAINLATTNAIFFPQRYLDRDGSYNTQRQEAEMWAQAAQNLDINPEPHAEEAAQGRQETIQLVGIFIPLSIALLFYTVAEALHPAQRTWRYLVAVLGTLFLLISIIATIMIEFF